MHLLDLPNEILLHILGDVGTSFFHLDLSRLTICKHWNDIARAVCFRDFHVTPPTIRRLLSSPYAHLNLDLIRNNLETLHLKLNGLENRGPSSEPRDDGGPTKWLSELNEDLPNFTKIMETSRKLRVVRIQANADWHPCDPPMRRNYLYLFTLRAILSKPAANLTVLELDLHGTDLLPYVTDLPSGQGHFCTAIAPLLTTLRRLRLRMRRLCSSVLIPEEHGITLPLREVLINLSLPYDSPYITLAPHATYCRYPISRFENLRLEDDMREQAQTLVTRMAEPKMVRILTHAPTDCGIHALDVLTGTNLKLSEDAEWDDPGEVLIESDDEAEVSELNSDEEKLYGVFQTSIGSGA